MDSLRLRPATQVRHSAESSLRWITALFAVLLLATLSSGCTRQEQVELTVFDVDEITQKAMQQLDGDGDDKLTLSELAESPGLKSSQSEIDLDKDRSISREELRTRLQAYVDEQIAILPYAIKVTYRGRPLTQAKITLIPESFLDGVVQEATGETDETGSARPTIELSPDILSRGTFGFRSGVYRVAVSKLDASGQETIPKKYNTETTLGFELKMDEHMEQLLRLNLR